ncbi:MAG: GlcG/HbpS family heme-binding protein [Janthinobacterium lividum]
MFLSATLVAAAVPGFVAAGFAQPSSAEPPQPAPISSQVAHDVLAAAEKEATTLHAPSSLAIADSAGDLVLFEQMEGARPSGISQAIGKAHTSARYRVTTESLEGRINSGRTAAVTAGLVQMRGGVPVLVGGKVVGAVGVSGVDNNNDVQVAGAAAAAVK